MVVSFEKVHVITKVVEIISEGREAFFKNPFFETSHIYYSLRFLWKKTYKMSAVNGKGICVILAPNVQFPQFVPCRQNAVFMLTRCFQGQGYILQYILT